ncbi:UDP-glucose/GDP-mannose dehydrogenase family protein [Nitriliruptoraceae bacterium ZYF776]|nr:UDP-glucose/GDP-mannose dehydrogenase family protein [Profundirhabdus halotolerans]
MKLAVIGVGHVGLVTAACLAYDGHEVVGMDDDTNKITGLLDGRMPFYEPDMEQLVTDQVAAGRLTFTDDAAEAIPGAEVVFVCVGTPPLPGGGPNLKYVEAVGRKVAELATGDVVLVEKSTVPANTGARLKQVIAREHVARGNGDGPTVRVASNPEFLREGQAVEDTLRPDRVVYGTEDDVARDTLRRVYAPLVERTGAPVVEADVATAELIKHASNAFLATRISFINQVSRICDAVGADVATVAHGMGLDERIGPHFLHAGLGYGGSCFPKDVDAFIHLARQVGEDFLLLEEVRRINEGQREEVLRKLRGELWHLEEKTVVLLGAAFKPGTDDLREAPALYLGRQLLEEGATVRIYDPVALDGVAKELDGAELYDDPIEALRGADAAIVTTEWDQVKAITPTQFGELLSYPIVVDARNAYDPAEMIDGGVRYHSMGRRSSSDHE